MRISDWSSDVCSSDLVCEPRRAKEAKRARFGRLRALFGEVEETSDPTQLSKIAGKLKFLAKALRIITVPGLQHGERCAVQVDITKAVQFPPCRDRFEPRPIEIGIEME